MLKVAVHGGRRVYKSATLQIRHIQVGPRANQSAQSRGPGVLSARAALNTFGLGRYLIQGARPAIHNSRGLWDNKESRRESERAQGGPQIVVTVLAGPGRCIVTAALCSKGGAGARTACSGYMGWLAGWLRASDKCPPHPALRTSQDPVPTVTCARRITRGR